MLLKIKAWKDYAKARSIAKSSTKPFSWKRQMSMQQIWSSLKPSHDGEGQEGREICWAVGKSDSVTDFTAGLLVDFGF